MKYRHKTSVNGLLEKYDKAQQYLIDSVKTGLYGLDKNVFSEKLDFYNDIIFLDPFFFACLSNHDDKFRDILIGCFSQNAEFIARTDEQGNLYLPKHGIYSFKAKGQLVRIHKKNEIIDFTDLEGSSLETRNTPIRKNPHGIEFMDYAHPLITSLFPKSILVKGGDYEQFFNCALSTINKIFPELFRIIIKSVKKVVFISGNDNSFATLKTHGIIYLNIREEYNEVSFIDDIVHQSAHVIFNTLTLQTKTSFFTPSYYSYLQSTNDYGTDDLYARLHGLYTMCLITFCLTRCLELNLFLGHKKIELIGRTADNMKKFKSLVENLVEPEYLEKEGMRWFSLFKMIYNNMEEVNAQIIRDYFVLNQPYVFDYNIFVSTNASKYIIPFNEMPYALIEN